ncbi:sulfatase family protein [Roseibacillus persicicus]|uniref:Sulfatase N-terminal domain-containing protein n=2 Tax=Roseibacillus persicicus TaxID=454148 RepID=A0A918TU19_9BACT|nr:sulfatase [Roseibacillus persicicus]MDQ8189790.1 sulfatase [Roseibacillus persicicus]GHC61934.1 hypothetical protein GCM10007100_31600 [Roseibacillus persicicus]
MIPSLAFAAGAFAADPQPNFVVIYTDDQGYADLSCFGGKHVETPRIDEMAREGARLTSFYMGAPLCTPSRAALMTGCYPKRIDMAYGDDFSVLLAADRKGLHPDEITMAEMLKEAGYTTGMFGKWHLGDQPDFLPTRQGFDEFFGLPYSHDIHPSHPRQNHFQFPPLPLLEGEQVVEVGPDPDTLTKRLTERAVDFIGKHKDEPFFLYIPHPIPHAPLAVSEEFLKMAPEAVREQMAQEGPDIDYGLRRKLFSLAISEIDWSVGQVLDALKENGLDEKTVVIFSSDNGPAAGKAHPLSGRKGSTLEGGSRVPTVIRWPGKIPSGQSIDEILTAMDLFPTFAGLAGAKIPTDRVIDGKDVWPVLIGQAESPHEAFFYYRDNDLKAVRVGEWKYHLGLPQKQGSKATPVSALYNLAQDVGEKENVIADHPELVAGMKARAEKFERELIENSRPAAFVEAPRALELKSE